MATFEQVDLDPCRLPDPHDVPVGVEAMCRAHCGRSWWRTEARPGGWIADAEISDGLSALHAAMTVHWPEPKRIGGLDTVQVAGHGKATA